MSDKINSAKGRSSYDSTSTGSIIPFFNRNVTPYATESSGPKFDLVPVTKQKDLMINHARMYAQQEYDRIMELVSVLEKQAQQIKRRLEITDAVHAAEFQFQLVMGNCYWLVWEKRKEKMLLVLIGPLDWNTGVPMDYTYISQVKYMGDHTWLEVEDDKQ
jgi:IS4 transposase